ncbi:MAG: antibiotic biosynthesis monooxygenase [Acidobacteria bacterium]|nr:antibiotic biosynthesis monooxygenase [Acidobacteriota bacterium]
MHCLGVTIRVRGGCEAAAADHLRALAFETRKEPGNVLYLVHRAASDPRQFFIYEQYRTPADHAAHRATAHYRRHAAEGLLPLAEDRTATVYELL